MNFVCFLESQRLLLNGCPCRAPETVTVKVLWLRRLQWHPIVCGTDLPLVTKSSKRRTLAARSRLAVPGMLCVSCPPHARKAGKPPPPHLTGHQGRVAKLEPIRDTSVATSQRAAGAAVLIPFFQVPPRAAGDPHRPAALRRDVARGFLPASPRHGRLAPGQTLAASERRALPAPSLCHIAFSLFLGFVQP